MKRYWTNLRESQRLALHYSAAYGSLETLADTEPKEHTLRARLCRDLQLAMDRKAKKEITSITPKMIEAANPIFEAFGSYVDDLAGESGLTSQQVLLNVALFHIDELGRSPEMTSKARRLTGCYPGSDSAECCELGGKAWQFLCDRIEAIIN